MSVVDIRECMHAQELPLATCGRLWCVVYDLHVHTYRVVFDFEIHRSGVGNG